MRFRRNVGAYVRPLIGLLLVFCVNARCLALRTPSSETMLRRGRLTAIAPTNPTSPHRPLAEGVKEKSHLETKSAEHQAKKVIDEAYGKFPLSFEVNQGQTDPQVKFLSRGADFGLFLLPQEMILLLTETETPTNGKRKGLDSKSAPSTSSLRIKLQNANPNSRIVGLDQLPGESNYFIGDDPTKWQTDVSNYARVKYEEVYPGVDMVYYGNQRNLEYDFIVSPGADPRQIKLRFEGTRKLRLDPDGDLVLSIRGREIRQRKPMVYQEVGGHRQEIASNYVLRNGHEVGIEVADYDVHRPLVIDPVLSYSTYLHSSVFGISLDSARNMYVVGRSWGGLPLVNPAQSTYGGNADIYIQKLNPAGSTIIYSTYLGGNDRDDGNGYAHPDIAVDSLGQAYVRGTTSSTNFPTVNAIQSTRGGSLDAYVAKLNVDGNQIVYSTYLGGSSQEGGRGIAVDLSGNAYVSGNTYSANFPTFNPLQAPLCNGSNTDVFVSVLNPSGSAFVYSTHLGGVGGDNGDAIAVDAAGNAYVTGNAPTSFPTTPGAYDNSGGTFIAKLNPAGSALVYSAQLGGNSAGRDIAIDSSGNAYVTGDTSGGLPTVSAFQPNYGGQNDAFVGKLDATGSTLLYLSYLGGGGSEYSGGIAVDLDGNAYLTGSTMSSQSLPLVNPVQPTMGGGGGYPDAYVTKVSASGTSLVFSTFLGGTGQDNGTTIAVDSDGNAYVAGWTNGTTDFPKVNPIQTTGPGGFLSKYTGLQIFTISGHITDATGAGLGAVTVTLSGSQNRTTQTNANGDYSFANVPSAGNYTVRPTKTGYSFAPTTQTFNNLSANQTADFTTLFYSISGRITDGLGAGLSAATLTLSGTQAGTTQTDASGNYSFPNVAAGGNYTITPSKTSYTLTYTFAPANRTFSNLSAHQTGADFSFTTATNVGFHPTADTYVQDGTAASTNFGTVTPMLLKTDNQSGQKRDVYLRFDLSNFTSSIITAKLRIYAALSASGSVSTAAYSVTDIQWPENTINWNNKPARNSTPITGSTATVTSTSYANYELDVTSYIVSEKAAGRDVVSLALHNPSNSTPHILLNSREAESNKPQLVITTSPTSNVAPAVSLTAPAGGAVYEAPANITVSANASDADGSVSRVDFYAGTVPIGNDTTSPYSFTWSPVIEGAYSLTAVATDNRGATSSSTSVSISVNSPNSLPTVDLTAPASGLTFPAGSNINLAATAIDVDGTISQVDFLAGGTLLGSDTAAPYEFVWSNAAAGAHSVTARATDNAGGISTSSPVTINVIWQAGLSPVADAYVKDGSSASTNFGTATELQVQQSATAGSNRDSYLKFDTATFNYTSITKAKLRLYGRLSDTSGTNVPVTLYPVSNTTWTESGSGSITWNNKPPAGTPAQGTVTITNNVAQWYEWDVTSYLVQEKTAGRHTITLAVKPTQNSSPYVTFNSKEAVGDRPQLLITTTAARSALMVTGSATLNAAETNVKTRVEALGFTVTVKAAGSNQNTAVKATDADGKALVLISSTVTPANVTNKFRNVVVPVVNWESGIMGDMGLTSVAGFGTLTNQRHLAVVNSSHSMAAGLSGTVEVVTTGAPNQTFTWGNAGTSAVTITTISGDATKATIFGYDTGAPLVISSLVTPARRVGFFLTDTTATSVNSSGWLLFDAAIKWACETPVAPTISSLTPVEGAAGTIVLISGYNFGASQSGSTVTFNGLTATPTSWNGTIIVVPVPGGAATGLVVVTAGGLASNGVTFTVNVPPLDSDGDGLPDSWEQQYFGNLTQGANDDPDGDGLNNLQEYQQGRNPTVNALPDANGAVNLKVHTPLASPSP